jgi:hypothetical protein
MRTTLTRKQKRTNLPGGTANEVSGPRRPGGMRTTLTRKQKRTNLPGGTANEVSGRSPRGLGTLL